MDTWHRKKWFILTISLFLGLTFTQCGKKQSGLLLLPNLAEGQGGPGISPENPKSAQETTTTQEESPSIQVQDDTGSGETTPEDNSGNTESNGDTGIVVPKPIEIQPLPPEKDNGDIISDPVENQPVPTESNNGDVASKPVEIQPVPAEIEEIVNDTDVSVDPQESTVVSESDNTATVSDNSTQEEIEENSAIQEENSADEQEEAEENTEIEENDDGGVVSIPEEDQKDDKGKACKIKVLEIDTSKGKWYNTKEELLPHPKDKKKTIKAKGIHTYWAYQKLLVKVNNNCENGKYRLTVVAKNIGKLPEWYHYFNLVVYNDSTGENLGSMLIRASDTRYHRGSLIITLPKGESVLNILWTNDAWQQDVYDANIQIKRIKITKAVVKEKKQILTRKGSNFCNANGRWFIGVNPPSVYTYWQDQTVSYCLRTPKAGKYEIIVRAGNAKNGLPLMPGYNEFKILVAANGKSNYITIPAEQGKYHKGSTTLDLPEGDVVLNITWLNDRYQPPEYDANIEITRVRIKRVGDLDSPISAFLLQNPNITNKVLIPGILLVLGALGLVYWIRKEKIA